MKWICISRTIRYGDGNKRSDYDHIAMSLTNQGAPSGRPTYSTTRDGGVVWFLTDQLHQWFVDNNIGYTLDYEFDWGVRVNDEHAVMVKLALGQ